jgi:hypothetical protein
VSAFCIAGAGAALRIATTAFTLSWTHTVEKTDWLESWLVAPDRLILTEARVAGSGAGMEPPPEARLQGNVYVWRPNEARREIVLRRDPHAGDWTLCANERCDALGAWLGRDADPVTLLPCP